MRPMNDLLLPCLVNVDTRGVDIVGKGTGVLLVKVMAEGVCAVIVGEGGNTKRVCDGVETGIPLLDDELRDDCEENNEERDVDGR